MLHLDNAANRRIGIALVTLTTLCFATLDACAKWLVQELPVLQVVWLRFLFHVLLTPVLLAPRYGRELVRVRDWRLQALRALMMGCMTALNFWALQYLQLAETGAIQFSVPLLIALPSAWWLGERLDARRWLAIGAGFAGVLLVVRPGSQAFHPAILLSVLNALLYAAELKKAGVPTELHLFAQGGHGYGLRHVDGLPVTDWPKACAAWLKAIGVVK